VILPLHVQPINTEPIQQWPLDKDRDD